MHIKKLSVYLFFILLIAALDQYSKYLVVQNFNLFERMPIIDGFLSFTYARNTGAAFSFGAGYHPTLRLIVFKILPVIVCLFFLKLLYDSIKENKKLMAVVYTLILGGAIGNLIDRIRLDYVVDFISVYHNGFTVFGVNFERWYFAIFNIADSAISIAAALIIYDYISKGIKAKNATKL